MSPGAPCRPLFLLSVADQHNPRSLIYLTGFMGSGKSTIGPILANTLGFPFIDIDRLIEEKAGQGVNQIFRELGEEKFRFLERDVLHSVSLLKEGVISLGGGTLANEENFRLIHSNGIIVYLSMSVQEASRRMQNKTDRPLLKDAEGNRLEESVLIERIDELMKQREEFYARADVIVTTEQKRVGATVDEIVRQLRPRMNL